MGYRPRGGKQPANPPPPPKGQKEEPYPPKGISLSPTRCQAKCQVCKGFYKNCIRPDGHDESHIWVESLDRVFGNPEIFFWSEDVQDKPDEIREMVKRTSHKNESTSQAVITADFCDVCDAYHLRLDHRIVKSFRTKWGVRRGINSLICSQGPVRVVDRDTKESSSNDNDA